MLTIRSYCGIAAAILLFAVALSYAIGKDAIQLNRQADAAIFEQITQNIYAGKGAVSNVFSATQNYIDRRYFALSRDELLKQALTPPADRARDMTRFHAYWVLYLLAPGLTLIGASLLLTSVQAVSLWGLVVGSAYIAFKDTRRLSVAIVFGLFLLCLPPVVGELTGQFYPDRLFIILGFVVAALSYFRCPFYIFFPIAILTASINERAALIAGISIILIPFCRRDKPLFRNRNYAVPALGVALILYSSLISRLYLSNLYYDSFMPHSVSEIMARFSDANFSAHALEFLAVNAALCALSLGNYRLAGVAFLLMVPNIVGNIGGAEKVGWTTHYHSYYIPVLVFAGTIGFTTFCKKLNWPTQLGLAFTLLITAISIFRYESGLGYLESFGVTVGAFNSFYSELRHLPSGYVTRSEVVQSVPAESLVATDETGMALLMDRAIVDFFPVSANEANYLLLPCSEVESAAPGNTTAWVSKTWLIGHGFGTTVIKSFPAIDHCLFSRS